MFGISSWVLWPCTIRDIAFFEDYVITWSTSSIKYLAGFLYPLTLLTILPSLMIISAVEVEIQLFSKTTWSHTWVTLLNHCIQHWAWVSTLLKLVTIFLVEDDIYLFYEYNEIIRLMSHVTRWVGSPPPKSQRILNKRKHKSEQACVKKWGNSIISNCGSYYKLKKQLLQNGATVTNWNKTSDKCASLL